MDAEGRGGRDGEYLVLAVRDNGCGIPLEHQARIFEPFFTTRSPEEGTGLGLTMVHVAVREHGGFVHLESAPGEGTLVELWIPAAAAAESVVPVELATRALPLGHETVLVVDDRDGPLLASKAVLESCGYHVELAWSAEAALKVVLREPIDLLVTDAVMPRMGGRELLEELRAQGYDFPAILMSGHDEEAAESGDFAATLRKPVDAYALASKVRDVLDAARAEGVRELSA
jgi:two-component system cell cycle sensor histidine kinase/response regulator CckA